MGRLDNAVRRAAQERGRDGDVGTIDFPIEQTHAFPSETMPAEPADDLPLQPVEPIDERAVDAAPAAATEDITLPSVETSPRSLLHQVDARLATKTVVDDQMLPASREQYRRLAAALHQAQRTNGMKVVMIASAVAGEGKTLTASNLAMTLSESYRRNVLLVDGDLRRPSLHTVFQVEGHPGLSDGLLAGEDPKLPLHRISPRLAVLPAGRPTSDPIGALTSERMRALVDEARDVFDWVIIDTPPVGLLTDASLLTSVADGVVLVIKAESTPLEMVTRAVEAIGRERVVGAVLNRAQEQGHRRNYEYYRYYASSTSPELPAKAGR